ncbi:uncharacterized protein LOC135711470 [Ochlerotatus camptorhynchus]|uniref:uncharacterized protein LOC135711470 n=1 Tax=Ochlerotatus camptorhynchus TaxID=644619 RepID=UPI0031DCDD82
MNNISAEEPPGIHNFLQKQNHSVQFPLDDDTILQNPSECPWSWFNQKALKSLRSALKLGQIIAAIVILVLTHMRNRRSTEPFEAFPEVPYIFFTINAMAVTVLLLGDSLLTARPLCRAFTPMVWFRMELWFTGLAAMVYHVLAYYVLIMSFQYYGLASNRVASAFGFVSAGLYLVDWICNYFSKRHAIIPEVDGGTDQRRQV